MPTLNHITYNIKNEIEGGISHRASTVSLRQVEYWVRYGRAFVAQEQARKTGKIHHLYEQDMGVIELVDVDKAQSSTVSYGCKVKATTIEIPKFVDLPSGAAMVYVGSVNKQDAFVRANPNTLSYAQHKRFTSKMNRYYFIGQRLYVEIPIDSELKYINVRGVFEDPLAVPVYNFAGTATYIDPEVDEYPLPESDVAKVTRYIMEREMQITIAKKGTDDIKNDSREARPDGN